MNDIVKTETETKSAGEISQYNQTKVTSPAPITPMQLIQAAVDQNADIEKLEKLMDLQDRYDAKESEKAFTSAMAAFKANPPKIIKDQNVAYGNTAYSHATLDQIAGKVAEEMSKHGLSHSWETEQKDGMITVSCVITHTMGHSKSTSLQSEPDKSGGKNSIQAVGSTVSYLQRYTLLSATGLAAGFDDDGQNSSKEPVKTLTQDQITDISDLMAEKQVPSSVIATAYGVESIELIPESYYNDVVTKLNNTKGKS